MRLDLVSGEFGDDASERDHVDALGELQRERRLLLDQQDAEAAPVEFAEGLEDLGRDLRREAERGSSSIRSFGSAISARPTASICCSPPESEPATWSIRSFRRGNSAKTWSEAALDRRGRTCRACRRRA